MKKTTIITLTLGIAFFAIAVFLTLFPIKVPVSFENNGSTCAGISDETINAELQKIKVDINGQARGSVALALANKVGYIYGGPELDGNLFCNLQSSNIKAEIIPMDLYLASFIFLLVSALLYLRMRRQNTAKRDPPNSNGIASL